MKKNWGILLLALLGLAILSGCTRGEEEKSGLTLYYLSDYLGDDSMNGGDAIAAVTVDMEGLDDMDTEEGAMWILEQLCQDSGTYISPLPDGVRVNSVSMQGRRIYVDFSGVYGNLTGIDLSLADFCVTLSLCQLEGVASVTITSNGRTLSLRDSQVLMEQDVVLSGMEDIVSTVRVELWFPDENGELQEEGRELELYEGQTLVEAVAEALEEGPREKNRYPVLPEDFTIRTVWVEEGTCWLGLTSESMAALPEAEEDQELVLEAICRAFFSLDTVEELRVLVDGSEVDHFGRLSLENCRYRPQEEA